MRKVGGGGGGWVVGGKDDLGSQGFYSTMCRNWTSHLLHIIQINYTVFMTTLLLNTLILKYEVYPQYDCWPGKVWCWYCASSLSNIVQYGSFRSWVVSIATADLDWLTLCSSVNFPHWGGIINLPAQTLENSLLCSGSTCIGHQRPLKAARLGGVNVMSGTV